MILFEDWLEELEGEVVSLVKKTGDADFAHLASTLGLSPASVAFLVSKLQNEGKI